MKCFYHSADLDGHCSGAIVKFAHPETELLPINYGDIFPWNEIQPGEEVFMVDFALQPFSDMERLSSICKLTWIDHHKTAIDEAESKGFMPWAYYYQIGKGACELTWEFIFPHRNVPQTVKLLSLYDVWKHDQDARVLPFQYRIRMEDTDPRGDILHHWWKAVFEEKININSMVREGYLLLEYEKQQNAKFCRGYAFETQIDLANDRTMPYLAICVNRGFTNSKIFDSVWDAEKYDLMITFCRLPTHKQTKGGWTVSLYSTKPEIDCGAIAKSFGGGGHQGAAGFQCDELPFQI